MRELLQPDPRMKFYESPTTQSMGIQAYARSCGVQVACRSAASLKPVRSVHFPNDIVFQDYVKHGELERIGRFIRARRVQLDTIYTSGKNRERPQSLHRAVCLKLPNDENVFVLLEAWQPSTRPSCPGTWSA